MACGAFYQPDSLGGLAEALGRMTENSKIIAGGTDLMISQRENPKDYDVIVSVLDVPELKEIHLEEIDGERWLAIGAAVRHCDLAEDPLIEKYFYGMKMAASHVGSQQIRNRGTIGGNVVNASVGGDMLPLMFLYHAEVEILDASGELSLMTMEDFYVRSGKVNLKPGQALAAIWLPISGKRSVFRKHGARKEVTIADMSMGISWEMDGDRTVNVEAVLGAVDSKPILLPEIKEAMEGLTASEWKAEELAEKLSERIREIRMGRTRPSKLRYRECEQLYKERAIKGLVFDILDIVRKGE